MIPVHPETGLHYHMVVPTQRGSFMDIRNLYSFAATKFPWISLISPEAFAEIQEGPFYSDPDSMFIVWDNLTGVAPSRGCKLGAVYAEAIGEAHLMQQEHIGHLYRFNDFHTRFDRIFVHTPWMAEHLKATYGWKTALLPLGYAPTVGVSEAIFPSVALTAFYGSMVGKRHLSVPVCKAVFGEQLSILTGMYGTEVTKMLNRHKTVLCLSHSDVNSFSTWRAWQAASSAAILFAERAPGGQIDSWPFVDGEHFIGFDALEPATMEDQLTRVKTYMENLDPKFLLESMEELRQKFYLPKVLEEYLIPATAGMR